MPNHKVAVIVGSLRKESFSRKMAQNAADLAPPQLAFKFIDISALPLYNEDLDAPGATPEAWQVFRAEVKSCDAVLFATPEYNRSVPGVLKNAIDVGSRPYGASVWSGRPAAIISVSPGALGAFGANHHLRQSLVFLDMPTLQQPEAYVGQARQILDDAGKLTNEGTKDFLRKFMQTFGTWIDKHTA